MPQFMTNLLIYQGNDIDTWNKILEPDDVLDTGNGFLIQMIENITKSQQNQMKKTN